MDFDFCCGLFKCLVGFALICSGIIGWPATRYILGWIMRPFTHHEPQQPIGSAFWDTHKLPDWAREETPKKQEASQFWDRYIDPDWMRRER